MSVTFDLPGKPHGKARPRFSRVTGRTYTPDATREAEGFIRHQAAQAMAGRDVMRGAVSACVEIEVDMPSKFSKKQRAAALAGEVFPTVKPDADNILKAIFDACNGVVYMDDKQVVEIRFRKRYSDKDCTKVTFGDVSL